MAVGIRSFVAIHLSPEAEAAVREARDKLREQLSGLPIKWVADENLHLTLRFLGHVPEQNLNRVEQSLNECTGTRAFALCTHKVSAFRSAREIRVIWVGISGELERVQKLQECIHRTVHDLVPHEETRGFQPHLTIARCDLKALADRNRVWQAISSATATNVEWKVNSFELMRSSLSPKGAIYAQLAQYQLF